MNEKDKGVIEKGKENTILDRVTKEQLTIES
jgi:hypothetical protein